jgi:hypothetical protein
MQMMLPAGMSRAGIKNSYWTFFLVAAIVLTAFETIQGLLRLVYAPGLLHKAWCIDSNSIG